jgi:hypothetical protein
MAPFAGCIDGVNERGLCITYNYAYTTDTAAPSVPISVVIAETLQRCSTVAEAVEWIRSRPRSGGGILMLADASGAIASLEVSSSRCGLRIAASGEDVLFHTNMFWTETMREIQIPDRATFTDKAPKVLRGRQVHESAMKRAARLKQLLEREEPLDLSALGRIMADHGVNSKPADTTLCVHGPFWSTTASLQLFPKSRTIRVAFDSACRAQHAEISL